MKLNGESRSNMVWGPISIRKLAGAVVLLLAAVGIGVVVREFRFRSSGGKDVAEAPKVVRQAEAAEVQNVEEEVPVEEVIVEPEAVEPEPVRATTAVTEADDRSDAVVEAETAAEPFEEDSRFNESAVKAKRARAALALIGYDREADEVWIQVINDPSVSANARSNLIEDLNEDGFPDPHNPTLDDLPMIEYRIDLIDDLSPYAMDKTNADAFKEARKDLVNMANRLTR